MAFWQVAAGGSSGRDYSRFFLDHGIAFVGGLDWEARVENDIALGDIVVLRNSMTEIIAAGVVVSRHGQFKGRGDKDWLWDFDGWSLPAWFYVDWHRPSFNVITGGLTRRTIEKINSTNIQNEALYIINNTQPMIAASGEPKPTLPVSDNELITHLVRLGLRPSNAEDLTQAIRRVRLLSNFYLSRDWNLTNEHSARVFLVVPFLLALGWSEQQLEIEMKIDNVGRADIACFDKPRINGSERASILIETKALVHGLDYAISQAHNYARNLPDCRLIVVSNGYCYKAFSRNQNTFSTYPSAYLNLMSPRSRYPLDPDNVAGALELLEMLIPI